MTAAAIISRARIVGGHDGRAEVEVELTYANGGVAVLSLDEESCLEPLDAAGVRCVDDLVGQPWTIMLSALTNTTSQLDSSKHQRQR